jgi:nucleoside-diphosphate-sugar epimerase
MSGIERNGAVLVTGASGYLGSATASALAEAGRRVRFGARGPAQARDTSREWSFYGDLAGNTELDASLSGCETVMHFAGLAHLPEGPGAEDRAWRVNVEGTARLAEAAARCGVKRFVFVSSAHVNGPSSFAGPFRESDPPKPDNVYARSKLEAEQRLKAIAGNCAMEWVIVRPPMVYGPGAPGNFQRLVKLVRTGLPVPLGGARGPKSFLYVGNLASAMVAIAGHPAAASKTFLVSDSEVTSTAGLLQQIAEALGRRVLLLNAPEAPLALAARVIGREKDVRRLFDPLEINSDLIRTTLKWAPPVALAEAVRRSVVTSP